MIRPWPQYASVRRMHTRPLGRAAKPPACAWLPPCSVAMSARSSLWRVPCGCVSLGLGLCENYLQEQDESMLLLLHAVCNRYGSSWEARTH